MLSGLGENVILRAGNNRICVKSVQAERIKPHDVASIFVSERADTELVGVFLGKLIAIEGFDQGPGMGEVVTAREQ